MPLLSTGFVIAGAYADKVRRVLFAQLRDRVKAGEIKSRTIATRASELNRLLFEILVNKLKITKRDVVRIRIEYDVHNGDIVWKLDTLHIEAFRRIPDPEIEKVVKDSIDRYDEILASTITEKERAWTKAHTGEVERRVQMQAKKTRTATYESRFYRLDEIGVTLTTSIVQGSIDRGKTLVLLKTPDGENIGLASLESINDATKVTVVIIPGRRAYHTTFTLRKDFKDIERNPGILLEALNNAAFAEIAREEAEAFIKTQLDELIGNRA